MAPGIRPGGLRCARFLISDRDLGVGDRGAARVLHGPLQAGCPGEHASAKTHSPAFTRSVRGGRGRGRHHGRLMSLRRERHRLRQSHHRPVNVIGLRDLLDERLRSARNEREPDVFPIFANRIVHDGPSLEQRLFARFVGQQYPIGALPHRHLADVTDEDFALAVACGGDGHAAQVHGLGRPDQVQVMSDLVTEVAVGDADRRRRPHFKAAEFACIAHEREVGDFG